MNMLDNIILQEKLDAVASVLESGKKFVVLSHKNPDGDAVGSSLAMYCYLRALGKDVRVVLPNAFPDFFSWMPYIDDVLLYDSEPQKAAEAISSADAFICLDFNSLSRIGDVAAAVVASNATKILIDHHLHPDDSFAVCISCPEACSTSELVYRVIAGISGVDAVSYDAARCIYTGMMTDTGAFAYASSRKDIFIIVAALLEKGIDKDQIYRNVFYSSSLSRMRLWGYVMAEKLKLYRNFNTALVTLTHKELMRYYASKGDTEGLVNQPLQIKGVRFSCFLREEQPGKINVSLRSVDDFPCNEVAAEFFNGGGHKNASGGEVHGTMEMAVERFRQAMQKYRSELIE